MELVKSGQEFKKKKSLNLKSQFNWKITKNSNSHIKNHTQSGSERRENLLRFQIHVKTYGIGMENVSEKNLKVIIFLSRKSLAISQLHLGENSTWEEFK